MDYGAEFLDLSEKESANSLNMANILEEDNLQTDIPKSENNFFIENALLNISGDLLSRWKGALFSLSPSNPDAGRHFCTSTREIFISILDYYAPDRIVIELENCECTSNGNPTRKSKIKYILQEKGFIDDSAVNFVNEDIDNILQLFRLFNDGTHEIGRAHV